MTTSEKKPFVNVLLDSYLDSNVYRDLLKTFAKESISLLEYGNLSISNMSSALVNQVQFSESEISPFHKHDIDCDTALATAVRTQSAMRFNDIKIDFSALQSFLIESFAFNQAGTRPYPSAGALYPVEALVFYLKNV